MLATLSPEAQKAAMSMLDIAEAEVKMRQNFPVELKTIFDQAEIGAHDLRDELERIAAVGKDLENLPEDLKAAFTQSEGGLLDARKKFEKGADKKVGEFGKPGTAMARINFVGKGGEQRAVLQAVANAQHGVLTGKIKEQAVARTTLQLERDKLKVTEDTLHLFSAITDEQRDQLQAAIELAQRSGSPEMKALDVAGLTDQQLVQHGKRFLGKTQFAPDPQKVIETTATARKLRAEVDALLGSYTKLNPAMQAQVAELDKQAFAAEHAQTELKQLGVRCKLRFS